jgi:rhodanese-related sulfurtransferase
LNVTLDPVRVEEAASMAEQANEPFRWIDVDEAKTLLDGTQVQIIDVREPWEYKNGHIPGALSAPLNTLLRQPQQYLKGDAFLFVCAVGERSAVACEMASALGFEHVYNLDGGTHAWMSRGLPLEQ